MDSKLGRRRLLFAAAAGASAVVGAPLPGWAGPSALLIQEYESVRGELSSSFSGAPLRVDSTEAAGELRGAIHAVVDFPFEAAAAALARPQVWCEVVTLHLNTKSCALTIDRDGTVLVLGIARVHGDSVRQGYSLPLTWHPPLRTAEYLGLKLSAALGPFGTTDYAIALQLAPLPGSRTFLKFDYSCRFGPAVRFAMQTYLATAARNKVGFSELAAGDGTKRLVAGLRGVVERTAMRYYLAIDAWLRASRLPRSRQLDARLEHWFDSTEQYSRQLREIDRESYLAMKRRELAATQSEVSRP